MFRRFIRKQRQHDFSNTPLEQLSAVEYGTGNWWYLRLQKHGPRRIELHRFESPAAAMKALRNGAENDHVTRPSRADDPWSGGEPICTITTAD